MMIIFGGNQMKIVKLIALTTFLALTSTQSLAGDDDWKTIAEKKVSYKSETDTVNPITSSHYSHIKVKCTHGTVNLKKIKVVMNNGEEKVFDNLGVLTKGMSSRSLNLPDKNDAKLDKIKLEYESVGSTALSMAGVTEKAEVEILAKKAKKED